MAAAPVLALADLATAAEHAVELIRVRAAIDALGTGTARLETIALSTPASPTPVTLTLGVDVPAPFAAAFTGALQQREANLVAALTALGAPTS
jgi:hypothetical protein